MILAAALLIVAVQTPAQEPIPCDYIKQYVWDPKFTPGQKWKYHSRSTDVGSTVTISEIDDVPGIGPVVHIMVDNLGTLRVAPVTGKTIGPNFPGAVEHFAIQRDSLAASVTDLVDDVPIPELGYSYVTYRAHCIALTYTTSVADTLAVIAIQKCEQNLQRHPKNPPLPCKPATSGPPVSPTRTR